MNSPIQLAQESKSILIVDDNPQNLEILGRLLQENNFEIEFALNGEATLEWLKIRKFDLVLLDVNMPMMNGFEVCTRIRSNPDMSNMPIIFLSAESERESILKGFELGAQDYVAKPFDSRELLARVRTHLALKDTLEKFEKLNKTLEATVTERTQQLRDANERLAVTNLKLLDLDKAKTEFLQLISHEIRTPLNGILGPVQLIRKKSGSQGSEVLFNILDISVRRLERFSLDALLITKLTAKRHDIVWQDVKLSELIAEVMGEERPKLESKNIEINYKAVDHRVSGERELIKKCISNILDNAVHFSPEKGTIAIETGVENNQTYCEITDQGTGFSRETTQHMFELFTTGKEGYDNTRGIGLPIVKMIMEAHNGNIIVGNNPGGGAKVRLVFGNNPG